MTQDVSGWLPNMIGPVEVQNAGVVQTPRGALNLIGVTITDNPTYDRLDITFPAVPTLAAGMGTWLGAPTSANLLAAMSDETGTGSLVFGTAPVFTTSFRLNATSGSAGYIFTPAALVASHVINLPLLTAGDNMVCEAFGQTLTNKTIVAASNTITDTSAATGDILRHNGTKFVRLARGSANQVLTTNAGATDIAWATPAAGSPAGSTGQIQYNNAGAFGGATNVLTGSGFISIGASPAATGGLRLASATGIYFRNAANGADFALIRSDGTDRILVGGSTSVNGLTVQVGSNILLQGTQLRIEDQTGATDWLVVDSTGIQAYVPILGGANAYGAVDGNVPIAVSTANITLTAAQYSRRTQKFTGAPAATRTITYPLPATDDTCYEKIVWGQTTGFGLTITNGGGLTVSIAVGDTPHVLWFHQGGVSKIT